MLFFFLIAMFTESKSPRIIISTFQGIITAYASFTSYLNFGEFQYGARATKRDQISSLWGL